VGSLDVSYPLASIDHQTADGLNRIGVAHLAAEGRSCGRIELAQTLPDAAGRGESEASKGHTKHLDVDGAHQLRQTSGLGSCL
jgi:hypothetical protein